MSLPNPKKIAIIGGGTNSYIANHLALSAPAYGTTANELAYKFSHHQDNKMEVKLYLTKMADPQNSSIDTPEDVETLVDKLIADPDTRVIIFNAAIVDYKPEQVSSAYGISPEEYMSDTSKWTPLITEFGKYKTRLSTKQYPEIEVTCSVQDKIINKIRKERKDIFLVSFKTTCGDTKEEQFNKGLANLKASSSNIVFVNDVDPERITKLNKLIEAKTSATVRRELKINSYDTGHDIYSNPRGYLKRTRDNMFQRIEDNIKSLQNNGLITPEESSYWYNTRDEALLALVGMVLERSNLAFTRSTVIQSETIPWTHSDVPSVLREVVDYCIEQTAYKPVNGKTVGHFACKLAPDTFLTSIRKTNFNDLSKIGLVRVTTDGPDHIYAYGAKPSVGGQSQRLIFDMHPELDCIVHFHCPLRKGVTSVNIAPQFGVECGSHECGENTAQGLRKFSLGFGHYLWAVHLDHHGPNIVFDRNTPAYLIIDFIEQYWDLSKKTTGLSEELK